MTEAIIAGLQDTKLSARCAATEKVADMIGGKSGLSNLQVSGFVFQCFASCGY